MKHKLILLIAIIPIFFSASNILDNREEVRLALIIGNGNYSTFGDLTSPLRNVDSMQLLLKNEMNFRSVDYLKDGTHRQMESKLRAFYRKISSYDKNKYKVVALFFYSGHGLADENKKNYLIPTDAVIDCPRHLKHEAINLDAILEDLDAKRSFLNLLMIDACRNTDYISKKLQKCLSDENPNMDPIPDMFEGITKPKINQFNSGTFISFSAAYGKTADSGDKNPDIVNSPYVVAFLENVRTPNKSTVDLFTKDVSRVTKQLTKFNQQPTTEIYFDDYFYFKQNTALAHRSTDNSSLGNPTTTDRNQPNMVFVKGNSTINDFYIGKYEVTVKEYLAFCNATNSNYPEWLENGNRYNVETGSNDYYKAKGYKRTGSENLPIVGVSWHDAVAYCEWLSKTTGQKYRLPTEKEWEYAAKGGVNTKSYTYAGSNIIDAVAWYYDNSSGKPHPVGQKNPNELKIYDMSGNVWEWCSDWADLEQKYRVLRGGSWSITSEYCRVANRTGITPSDRYRNDGFRVVRP